MYVIRRRLRQDGPQGGRGTSAIGSRVARPGCRSCRVAARGRHGPRVSSVAATGRRSPTISIVGIRVGNLRFGRGNRRGLPAINKLSEIGL